MDDRINHLEKLVEIQKAARLRFARNLHDGPTQSIAALTLRINYLRRLLEKDPESVPDELLHLEDSSRQITTEMRYLLFTLQPLVLESSGLVPAFHTLAEKTKDAFNTRVKIEIDGSAAAGLDKNTQKAVFYITEERLYSAVKHDRAAEIRLQLSLDAGSAKLDIHDNGTGLPAADFGDDSTDRSRQGDTLLCAWCELLQAELSIDSQPGKGTHIQVLIPLSPSS